MRRWTCFVCVKCERDGVGGGVRRVLRMRGEDWFWTRWLLRAFGGGGGDEGTREWGRRGRGRDFLPRLSTSLFLHPVEKVFRIRLSDAMRLRGFLYVRCMERTISLAGFCLWMFWKGALLVLWGGGRGGALDVGHILAVLD